MMPNFYHWVGRLFFPGRQNWEQRRNAKTLVLTVAFTLALGLAMAEIICIFYNQQK